MTEMSTPRRVVLVPTVSDVIDAGFVLTLCILALVGFRTTYSGFNYLIVGVAGVLLGILIGSLATALRQPMISVAAMAVAVFFLLGGAVTLRAHTSTTALPTGGTLRLLASVSVHGWKQLLTTLPPVDSTGPLLAIPYILGILGGVGGFTMARRIAKAAAPILAPALVLSAVILLGTESPAARVLQGSGFAIIALAWASIRSQRQRPPIQNGARRQTKLVTAVILLAITGIGATYLGPNLPGAAAHRVVLRSHVIPPFDISAYPSPLVGFRKYTEDAKQDYSAPLFTVTGLPPNSFMRIATLDSYDGAVWGATNGTVATGPGQPLDTFQRVGSQIASTTKGARATVTVTIDDAYAAANDVNAWLPSVGTLTSIGFDGSHGSLLASQFRYNLATNQGVIPGRLSSGDRYTFTATVGDTTLSPNAQPYGSPTLASSADSFTTAQADQWSKTATGTVPAVLAVAKHLVDDGAYTDGGPDQNLSKPGHNLARLATFLSGNQPVGDDEQYAATFALMSNALGLPARVVLGAVPEPDGTVEGKDVHAWVEVHVSDGSWDALSYQQFMPPLTKKPDKTPPQQTQEAASKVVPPPNVTRPPTDLTDAGQTQAGTAQATKNAKHSKAPYRLPGYLTTTITWGGPPILAILLVCAIIVGIKAGRRSRRRKRGPPTTRVALGWREVLDHARDLGSAIPAVQTRHEQAETLATYGLSGLAFAADARIFGPDNPSEQAAQEYWAQVDRARKDMSQQSGRVRRLRAALSLRSLRRPRPLGSGLSS